MEYKRCVVVAQNSEYDSNELPFPPIGSKGTIVQDVDEFGEYEIEFDDYPPCAPLSREWSAHHTMVVVIPDENSNKSNSEKRKVEV